MKPYLTAIINRTPKPVAPKRLSLKPRSTYPTLSIVPLHRSPLRKLAWIFGFGR